ncbi:MAG: hypothetical protein LBQ31_01855 [Bacteroidales bacterium]|jgi:site-specific DNA-methyltransferase (adenine-specific)|nr:hypothetical protein [Bacteroidales bacterium]
MLIDKTCFMLISGRAKYIQATLSSKLFELAYKTIFSSVELGTNGYQYNKHALIKLPIFPPNKEAEQQIENLLQNKDYKNKDYKTIDKLIYEIYDLTEEEIQFIESL